MAIIPIIRHAATHNAAVRRWATSLAWTSPTTTIAARRCSAAPTCWSADAKGRKYTSSMARAVANAEAPGEVQTRAESVDSASVRWLPCPHCQGSGYDPDPPGQAPASPPQRPAPPRVDPTVAETLGDLERRYEAPREPRPAPQPAPPTPSKQPPVESPPQRVEQQEPVQRPPPPRQAQQPPRETRPQPSQQGAPPPPAAPPPRELGDPERRPPTSASRQQGHVSSGGGCSGRLVVWLVLIALSGIGGYVASNDDLRGRIAGAFGGGDDTPAVVVSIPPPVPPTPLPTPVPVVAAPTPMPTPATVVAVAPPPPPTATPLPTPVPTQVPVPTLVPTATPIREELLESLRLQAVGLINEVPCDQWPGNGRTGLE